MMSGWGRYPRLDCEVRFARSEREVAGWVGTQPLIARGNGRAYGDSALNPGLTLDMTGCDRLIAFDESEGMLVAGLIMRTNYEGPASLLGQIAERFAARGSGTIIGISSVAGDRGRASNYVYGSAKAGFSAFLSGLRNRCFKAGVHVMTVKPGFLRTRMTQEMDLPGPVTAEPQEVAKRIYRA